MAELGLPLTKLRRARRKRIERGKEEFSTRTWGGSAKPSGNKNNYLVGGTGRAVESRKEKRKEPAAERY